MVKKVTKAAAPEDTAAPAKKVKKAAAPAPAPEKAKRGPPQREPNPNETTLSELCEELGIEPRAARVKLRKAENLEKGEGGRWAWRNGSKELGAVRKFLEKAE